MPSAVYGLNSERRKQNTASIGLMIAIASWALMFITLLWGYIIFRLKSTIWIEGYLSAASLNIAIVNTMAIICSAVFYRNPSFRWLSFFFGLVFLAGQFYLWHELLGRGFDWKLSIAGSFFYLLTGFHALHMAGGLAAIGYVCLNPQQSTSSMLIKGVQYFWDLLLFVWVVLFILIFIVK